eukprot:11878684-Ditylum_brightwellii.AAC.2
MAPTLQSSRTSVTPNVFATGRNPTNKATAPREPTNTVVGHPMGTIVQQLIAALAGPTPLVVMAITHTKMTINIIWAGTAMTTTGTISQEGIKTMIAKAAAMSANLITLTSMSIIMTKEVKEAMVVMIGKKEIDIVLVTMASHIMWRRSTVTLALNPRVAATFQAAAAFQAAATLVLILSQVTARGVTITAMWRIPTWT